MGWQIQLKTGLLPSVVQEAPCSSSDSGQPSPQCCVITFSNMQKIFKACSHCLFTYHIGHLFTFISYMLCLLIAEPEEQGPNSVATNPLQKILDLWGAWLAQWVEHAAPSLGVVSWRPM